MVDIANVLGIVGVSLTLIAYYFLNINKLSSADLSYLWLNFIGSSLILMSLLKYWNLASFIIEVAWIMISLIGLYRFYKRLPE